MIRLRTLYFFILCSSLISNIWLNAQKAPPNPLLIAVLMIKNEETQIIQTLTPLVEGGISSFFIFDTGSTDNTVKLIKDFFKKNNLSNSVIKEEPFIDFATSRNRALELAEQQFPDAGFFLMLDAEWYLRGVPDLIEFCKKEICSHTPLYLINLINPMLTFYAPRLFRASAHIRYTGAVHEVPIQPTGHKVPKECSIDWHPSNRGLEKSKQRWIRDRDILLREYEKNPQDPRTVFYLAQTYLSLHDWHNAYKYYKERIKLFGWEEENFMAWYRLGIVTDYLNSEEGSHTWDEALSYYRHAYKLAPHRAEPLIMIAHHYVEIEKDPAYGYMFAKRACELPYPDDVLFIQKNMYDILRHQILALCAASVDEYQVGMDASQMVLKAKPNDEGFTKMVDKYKNMLNKKIKVI